MSCLSYNCWGLGNPGVIAFLKDLVSREAPSILFLCETKMSGCELNKVLRRGRAGGWLCDGERG
ncbi:hypothetical protein V2J09_015906 [Rumex salicifolius]